MTLWNPELLEQPGTKVDALCAAVAERIGDGRLAAGQRLPSQRDLAARLSVALGTVTRAYRRLERRGLVVGEVGRGTFVRHLSPKALRMAGARPPDFAVDLFQNFPLNLGEAERRAWADTLDELRRDSDLTSILRRALRATPRQVRAAELWFRRLGVAASVDRVRFLPTFEAALAGILAARLRPGQAVGLARLSLPLHAETARALSLRTHALPIDAGGLDPDGIERALAGGVRAIVCVPTFPSPDATLLADERRRAVAELLRRYDAFAVELDACAPLCASTPPPLAAHAPERTFLVCDPRYALSFGVHVQPVLGPDGELALPVAQATALAGPTPALPMEVFARWVESGRVDELVRLRRGELRRRAASVRAMLTRGTVRAPDAAHHAWVELPPGVRSEHVVALAEREGVAVNEAAWFALERRASPEALRVCHGNAVDVPHLERALAVLDRTIAALERRPLG